MIQKGPLLIFRIFRVDTKFIEVKGSPLDFFDIVRPYSILT